MYDHIINTLILIADFGILFLMWKDKQRKAQVRTARKFNKILKAIGI